MKLEGRNLSVEMQPPSGEDVKLLHRELRQLGHSIGDDEFAASRFGDTTRQAVRDFQKKSRLPETGTVDEPTALEINRQVAARQTRDGFIVRGYVRNATGDALPDITVRAYDADLPSLGPG